MSNVLGGLRNNYVGTNASNPPNLWYFQRNPNVNDSRGYSLGDFLLNTNDNTLWYLASLQGNETSNGSLADWIQIAGMATEFQTDDGIAVDLDGIINILGGSNILTSAVIAPNTVTINLIDSPSVTGSLTAAGNISTTAGDINLPFSTAALGQIRWGGSRGVWVDAASNLFLGTLAGNVGVTGVSNVAIGTDALGSITTGSINTTMGVIALENLTTGSANIAIGSTAGDSYTTDESSNILLGSVGVILDANTIRIGTQGAALGEQDKCFIAGITGVATANTQFVTIDTVTGQLGAAEAVDAGIAELIPNVGTNATAPDTSLLGGNGILTTGTLDNTITFDLDLAFTTDNETVATAADSVINFNGGNGIVTTAAGSSVTTTLNLHFDTDAGEANPAANTINFVGGAGIETSAAGSTVRITSTAGGLTWITTASAAVQMIVNNGYVSTYPGPTFPIFTLPVNSVVGDKIEIIGNVGFQVQISQNAGQQIGGVAVGANVLETTIGVTGNTSTPNPGLTSGRFSIGLVCVVANTYWVMEFPSTATRFK